MAGSEFFASSSEEGFARATEMKGEAGAATMAGFGRDAAQRRALGYLPSSEEEDFVMAMEKEGEEVSATLGSFGEAAGSLMGVSREAEVTTMIASFEEAAVSSMGASTVVEGAVVMAGLVSILLQGHHSIAVNEATTFYSLLPRFWNFFYLCGGCWAPKPTHEHATLWKKCLASWGAMPSKRGSQIWINSMKCTIHFSHI
jgi:hypothetical protein